MILPWFNQHKREQAEAARKIAAGEGSSRYFRIDPVIELTKRDLYRFSSTSNLLYAFEAIGGKIESADINGKIRFSFEDWKSSITIAEKMVRGIGPHTASKQVWTAFPSHHHSGLISTSFLRFTMDVFTLAYYKREWVEAKGKSSAVIISQIVEFLPQVIHIRAVEAQQRNLRQLERAKEDAKAEKIENENRRIVERWKHYRHLATDWQEAERLQAFLNELREKAKSGEYSLDGVPLSEWIELAEKQIAALNPFDRLVPSNLNGK